MSLVVRYRNEIVGRLNVREDAGARRFEFAYAKTWLTFEHRFPMSVTMPLGEHLWGEQAHRFVQNLLPEGGAREAICASLKIEYDDDVALLEALGGDTAGAFVFAKGDDTRCRNRQLLSEDDLAHFSKGLPIEHQPGEPIRLSLAGAQHKTTVVIEDGVYYWPGSDEASTHILKFDSPRFPHLSINEFFVMRLARAIGLPVVSVNLDVRADKPFLVVERYDRIHDNSVVERLHQEDFCQILGFSPRQKYDVGLVPVSEAIREYSSQPALDIRAVIKWLVFNVLAGNADGHAKNISMLREGDGMRLAPFYDLVCTRYYSSVDRMLAMPVGRNRDSDTLGVDDWRAMAEHIGVQVRVIRNEIERTIFTAQTAIAEMANEIVDIGGQPEVVNGIEHHLEKRIRSAQASLKSPRW